MNCLELEYENEFFDFIIDKSTIDALICGKQAYKRTAQMLKECQRVLKTGGYYICVSFGQPLSRELHFKRPHLKFNLQTIKIEDPKNKTPAVSFALP